MDGLVCSLNAAFGVDVYNWALIVHDCGWDVRAGIVFDVDDARFLIALKYHVQMTCEKHVVGECSFCITITRAFARYNVSKKCFRQTVTNNYDGDWFFHRHP